MEGSTQKSIAKIRNANHTDLPQLRRMVQALAEHHGDVPQITQEILEREIFGIVPWIYVIIAEADGRAVGYAALCPLIKLQMGTRGIDMHHLFVEPAFRAQGIGKQLIEGAMRKARELSCSQISVGTHPDNLDAQAVYLACGFEQRYSSHPKFRIAL
ncbi:MAG: GNAT family N-acetyltransferase [Pseudomonadota bacterium]